MIQMNNISNQYGTRKVLQGVSLSVGKGEFWVLFGADDAGKTTLLHLLMGYNTSYTGQLALLGSRPNWMGRQQRERVRFVPDDLLWEDTMTSADFFRYAGNASARYDVKTQQMLSDFFKLPAQRVLTDLSYQENKLIQIVAALAARPEVLILDEPMNLLEPDVWRKVLSCITFFQKQGMAVLMTAVDYEDALGQSSHYAYLLEGRLITGEVREDTGTAKRVTAIREDVRQSALYEGDVSKLQDVLINAGFQDWTIENMTLREELDMRYAAQR